MRYSLRFAWIGLTIFLLVFSCGASRWKRATEHDAIVERLLAGDFAIEQDEVTWFGHWPVKRVIGLIGPFDSGEKELQAFLDLPRPWELRGLSLRCAPLQPEVQEKLFAQLERCTALEQLHLHNVRLTAPQAKQLGALKKLRILNFKDSWVPPESLGFLNGLAELEILHLRSKDLSLEQVAQLQTPSLRKLHVAGCQGAELPLTKAGFGRFPLLEHLTLEEVRCEAVACEAGAMPRLEVLGIAELAKPSAINWSALPEAAPELRALAIHATQFGFSSREPLLRMTNLRRLLFAAHPYESSYRLVAALHHGSWVNFRYGYKDEVEALVQARPELRFPANYETFLSYVQPGELNFWDQGSPGAKPHWASEHWLKPSLAIRKAPQPVRALTRARLIPNAPPLVAPSPIPQASSPAPEPPPYALGSTPTLAPESSAPTPPAVDPFAPACPPPTPNTAADAFAPAPAPTPPTPDPAWLKNFGPAKLN